MDKLWLPWNFETAPGGVSSAVSPDLLPTNQFAWGNNVDLRGAKPQTRPNFNCRMFLPLGLFQGASYFGVQGGMIVVQIAGFLYRLRIGTRDFSYEAIPLGFKNSGIIKQVWMQQTIETLVIQDGQSNAILYNGSTARRAGVGEVPLGRMMAYGNGRLWVAIGERQLVAGDIRTNTPGSELKFTETNYLSGGGALYFPRGITGLAFNAVTGTTDYGTLLVFSSNSTQSIRADITQRDQWASYPGFVSNVLRTVGCAGQWSITEVNQDLFWRDASGGIRSLRSSIQDESGPGSAPISREVSRLVNFDSQQLLPWVSSIYFDNRLLSTSSPYLNVQGGRSFRNLVSLDFAPISTMQGKLPPAYNGAWSGVNWAQLITGQFNGRQRAFGISSDPDGINRLWEMETRDRSDIYLTCGSGAGEQPITWVLEYPRIDFGSPKGRKDLKRCDVWLSSVSGEVNVKAYWRSDNTQKWTQWDEVDVCAKVTDASTTAPHTWKNLLPEQRPQIKSFTIPDGLDEVTKYSLQIGFQFQIRLVFEGKAKVERCMLWAQPISDLDYANRDADENLCIENDVTGNEVVYEIPLPIACAGIEVLADGDQVVPGESFDYGTVIDDPIDRVYVIQNVGGSDLNIGTVVITDGSGGGFSILTQPDAVIPSGESSEFTVRFALGSPALAHGTVSIPNNASPNPFEFLVEGQRTGFSATLQFREKTGTASLGGYDEYTDPSSPPKKYRVQTLAGTAWSCAFTAPGCATRLSYSGGRLQGTGTYDAATLAFVSTMENQNVALAGLCSTGADAGAPVAIPGPGFSINPTDAYGTTVDSKTSVVRTNNGLCVDINPNHTAQYGTNSKTLTGEDTEADAIARFDAGGPYGSWGSTVLTAEQEARTTGFDFDVTLVQYRADWTGLEALFEYEIDIFVYRRLFGSSDPFVLFETLTDTATSDGSGDLTYSGQVPNESGYETQVQIVTAN